MWAKQNTKAHYNMRTHVKPYMHDKASTKMNQSTKIYHMKIYVYVCTQSHIWEQKQTYTNQVWT